MEEEEEEEMEMEKKKKKRFLSSYCFVFVLIDSLFIIALLSIRRLCYKIDNVLTKPT